MKKSVYLRTMGCQMNERDSEEILGMLTAQGYGLVQEPEEADVILLNTCSVREHAEERAIGKMADLSRLKRERPELILGILGCMAKAQKEVIFKRLPAVDLVAGPAELYDLPYLLGEVETKRRQQSVLRLGPAGPRSALTLSERSESNGSAVSNQQSAKILAVGRTVRPLDRKPSGDYRRSGPSAFVTIMEGCDKRCSYCIVPFTRGIEVSRPAEEIVEEVRRLAGAGYQEVTLLGQNVNSYGKRFADESGFGAHSLWQRVRLRPDDGHFAQLVAEGFVDFAELLRLIDRRTGMARVRFTTSHPFDAHERLFQAMADCESLCEHLHLPVQSGSNRVLKQMRRGYTVERYLEKIAALRRLVPEIAITTDIIAGFPGETDEDFQLTKRLMQEVQYDSAFIFKYSIRPGTESAGWADDVPVAVKEERNQVLLKLQDEISRQKYAAHIGQTVEVLVEGPGKRAGFVLGKTRTNKNTVFAGETDLVGHTVPVRITEATAHTLIGALA